MLLQSALAVRCNGWYNSIRQQGFMYVSSQQDRDQQYNTGIKLFRRRVLVNIANKHYIIK